MYCFTASDWRALTQGLGLGAVLVAGADGDDVGVGLGGVAGGVLGGERVAATFRPAARA